MARKTKAGRAFVYIETQKNPESPEDCETTYKILFAGSHVNGSTAIQSTDENNIREELIAQKSKGVTLVSKLPPKMGTGEGTIERHPYDLSWLK